MMWRYDHRTEIVAHMDCEQVLCRVVDKSFNVCSRITAGGHVELIGLGKQLMDAWQSALAGGFNADNRAKAFEKIVYACNPVLYSFALDITSILVALVYVLFSNRKLFEVCQLSQGISIIGGIPG